MGEVGELGWEASSKNLVTWGDLMPGTWRYFNCPEAFHFFAILLGDHKLFNSYNMTVVSTILYCNLISCEGYQNFSSFVLK